MTNATNIIRNISTGNINKNNWSGEEATVNAEFDTVNKIIRFDLGGYQWKLVFMTWEELDGPSPNMTAKDREDLCRLIGSGGWALVDASAKVHDRQVWIDGESFGKPEIIESGERDKNGPEAVLRQACVKLWNTL